MSLEDALVCPKIQKVVTLLSDFDESTSFWNVPPKSNRILVTKKKSLWRMEMNFHINLHVTAFTQTNE